MRCYLQAKHAVVSQSPAIFGVQLEFFRYEVPLIASGEPDKTKGDVDLLFRSTDSEKPMDLLVECKTRVGESNVSRVEKQVTKTRAAYRKLGAATPNVPLASMVFAESIAPAAAAALLKAGIYVLSTAEMRIHKPATAILA